MYFFSSFRQIAYFVGCFLVYHIIIYIIDSQFDMKYTITNEY